MRTPDKMLADIEREVNEDPELIVTPRTVWRAAVSRALPKIIYEVREAAIEEVMEWTLEQKDCMKRTVADDVAYYADDTAREIQSRFLAGAEESPEEKTPPFNPGSCG